MPLKVLNRAGSADQANNQNKGNAYGARAHSEGTGTATGINAHAEGTDTTASTHAAHAEGNNTTAGGSAGHAEGQNCSASGNYSHAEGYGSTAPGITAHAEGDTTSAQSTGSHTQGTNTVTTGYYAHAEGAWASSSRWAQHAQAGSRFAAAGDSQTSIAHCRSITTDASPVLHTMDGYPTVTLAAPGTNLLTIGVDRAMAFRLTLVARRHDVSGDAAMWTADGLLYRDGNTATPAVLVMGAQSKTGSAGAAAWDVTIAVDSSTPATNYLAIRTVGEAGKTIRWSSRLEWAEAG